jgi:hypothetical protein
MENAGDLMKIPSAIGAAFGLPAVLADPAIKHAAR